MQFSHPHLPQSNAHPEAGVSTDAPLSRKPDGILTEAGCVFNYNSAEREVCTQIDYDLIRGDYELAKQKLTELHTLSLFGRASARTELGLCLLTERFEDARQICSILAMSASNDPDRDIYRKIVRILDVPPKDRGNVLFDEFSRSQSYSLIELWGIPLLLASGHYGLAERHAKALRARMKDSVAAATLVLRVPAMHFDQKEAAEPLGNFIEPPSDWDAESIYEQSCVAFKRREPRRFDDGRYAILEFERRLLHHPKDALTLYNKFIGTQGHVPALREYFKSALAQATGSVKEKSPPPTREKIQALLGITDAPEKIADLLLEHPDCAVIQWGLANCEMRKVNLVKAGQHIIAALKFDPTFEPALIDGARLAVARANWPVAHHLLSEYRAAYPDSPSSGPLEGVLLFALRKEPITPALRCDVAIELRYIREKLGAEFAGRIWKSIRALDDADFGMLEEADKIHWQSYLRCEEFETKLLLRQMRDDRLETSHSIVNHREKWEALQIQTLQFQMRDWEFQDPQVKLRVLMYAMGIANAGNRSAWLLKAIDEMEKDLLGPKSATPSV